MRNKGTCPILRAGFFKPSIHTFVLLQLPTAILLYMKLFHVYRPYCTPSGFNILAHDEGVAVALANRTFGYCSGTEAREIDISKAQVLPSCSTDMLITTLRPKFKK